MLATLAIILFGIGTLASLLTIYLNFVRYPLYKLLGRKFHWVSGIPLVGSLFLFIAAPFFYDMPVLFWFGIIIGLFDTGGIHWFAGVMVWTYFFRRE